MKPLILKKIKLSLSAAIALAAIALLLKYSANGNTALEDRSIKPNPQRIAVLDYGTLDTFDALGIKAKLAVPKNYMPSYLSKYKSSEYENIGGLKEFNLESINAFKPDLIVISARQQDYKNKLEEIAPVYFVKTSVAKDQLAETIKNIEFFGKLFGVPEKADLAIKDIRADVERTKRKAKENPLRTLVLIANDGKVSAFGSGSRFGMVHDALGLVQADPGIKVGRHGQLVNFEYIAELNPDLILVIDRSAAIGKSIKNTRVLDNALVGKTNAAKNNRIIKLDPECWYLSGGGIISVKKMISEVEEAISK